MYADPLRKHDCSPVTDGAAAIVLAAGDKAREVRDRPAWINGLSHYIDPMGMGTRDLTRSPVGRSARPPPSTSTGVEVAELHAPFSHQELILRRELGLADDVRDQPVGRRADQQPDVLRRRHPDRRGRLADLVRRGLQGAWATRPPGPPCSRTCSASWARLRRSDELMAKQPAAVVGVGQTHHRAKRLDVSMAGLCREAIDRALEDAGMTLDEIDAIVVGKAPDLFEGVMMPELFLAEALGAAGKPLLRVHTAGSVGGSTAIVAASLVQAGVHKQGADRRLREAVGVQRDVGALGPAAVQHAGARRRRRLLRAARALLHPPLRRARPTSARSWRPRTATTR